MSRPPKRGRAVSASSSAWTIQRERLRLEETESPPASRAVATPADKLPDLLRQIGLEDRQWEKDLLDRWRDIVGPQLSSRIRPGSLRRGEFTVYVCNSAWMFELSRTQQPQLLQSLQRALGENRVRSIRLEIDPDPARA
jgi:predicted nucleic acid-binding Zn ribbon protein